MIPLAGIGGEQAAYVTYFGAVGAGCAHPKEAYDFLRLFLTAEAQYESGRPSKEDAIANLLGQPPIFNELIEEGWPVRAVGSVPEVWSIFKGCAWTVYPNIYRDGPTGEDGAEMKLPPYVKDLPLSKRGLITLKMTDSDLAPMLEASFDRVYFGSYLEQRFARMVRALNDIETGAPTDVDIRQMAEDFVREMTFHVCEG